MPLLSASRMQRVVECPASATLPQFDTTNTFSERGTAIHKFLEICAQQGRDAALAAVSSKWRVDCEEIVLDRLPLGDMFRQEVTVIYDVASGEGREVSIGGHRQYPQLKPTEIAGTADVICVDDGDTVYVGDYKTHSGPDSKAPPAEENLQLGTLALALCRAHGKAKAHTELIHIWENGEPTFQDYIYDAASLAAVADKLLSAVKRVADPPPPRPGPWCSYCPAVPGCPAIVGLFQGIMNTPLELVTAENAPLIYRNVILLKTLTERLRAGLEIYAETHPIVLPNGNTWGPVESQRESLDGEKAFTVLVRDFGMETAMKAVGISKAAVKDALRSVAAETSQPLVQLERKALAAIKEAHGIEKKTSVTFKEYK